MVEAPRGEQKLLRANQKILEAARKQLRAPAPATAERLGKAFRAAPKVTSCRTVKDTAVAEEQRRNLLCCFPSSTGLHGKSRLQVVLFQI